MSQALGGSESPTVTPPTKTTFLPFNLQAPMGWRRRKPKPGMGIALWLPIPVCSVSGPSEPLKNQENAARGIGDPFSAGARRNAKTCRNLTTRTELSPGR